MADHPNPDNMQTQQGQAVVNPPQPQIDLTFLSYSIATTILSALCSPAAHADGKVFMSAKQAAKRLGIGDTKFRALVKAGKIRFSFVGKRRKFTENDLDEYRKYAREDAEECRFSSRKARRTGTTISNSKAYDITVLRASLAAKTQK